MKKWVNDSQLRSVINYYGGNIIPRYSDQYSNWRTIKFPENVNVKSIYNQLKNNSLFEYVEYNFVYEPQGEIIPNDPLFNQQWYLKNTGQYPTNSVINISFISSINEPIKLEIYYSIGNRIKDFDLYSNVGENSINLKVNDIASGIYVLKLSKSSKIISKKFCVLDNF